MVSDDHQAAVKCRFHHAGDTSATTLTRPQKGRSIGTKPQAERPAWPRRARSPTLPRESSGAAYAFDQIDLMLCGVQATRLHSTLRDIPPVEFEEGPDAQATATT